MFANTATVKAWCVTSFSTGAPLSSGWGSQGTAAQMTERNFIDGYNLGWDDAAYLAMYNLDNNSSTGALPFKFVTPLETDQYKIFVQPKIVGNDAQYKQLPYFAHALNTRQYPKTKNGFWIRYGQGGNSTAFAGSFMSASDSTNHLRNAVVGNGPQHGQILNRKEASAIITLQVIVL
jgi:hypothetical protein